MECIVIVTIVIIITATIDAIIDIVIIETFLQDYFVGCLLLRLNLHSLNLTCAMAAQFISGKGCSFILVNSNLQGLYFIAFKEMLLLWL